MASGLQVSAPVRQSQALPTYGFGPDITFEALVKRNPFLFRVYTPKPRSPFFDSTEPFFVGQRYNEEFTATTEDLRFSFASDQISATSTYADVARHMDWTTRSTSPFISTSFSFAWAIWEAVRRYHVNVKHDIEIAIIDARAVEDRAVTALELLRKSTSRERHRDYWKWYQFAVEAQDVLVHGFIPGTAVLASIPLLSILDKLPGYFLSTEVHDRKVSPFERLAWDYADRKPSYRQFCQMITERFLSMSTDQRLRDVTGGSVRLAVELLRPWFHKASVDDLPQATMTVCDLAFVIAQWPAPWWSRDHGEVWDLIQAMVAVMGEEVREKRKGEVHAEVKKLQEIVGDLERIVQDHESHGATSLSSRPSSRLSQNRLSITSVNVEPPSPIVDTPVSHYSPTTFPPKPQEESVDVRPHSMVETASCIVTGLLFGAFITLCIINSQRRTLITHLT